MAKKSHKDTVAKIHLLRSTERRIKGTQSATCSKANLKWKGFAIRERGTLTVRSVGILFNIVFDKDVDRNNLMKEKCIWFQLCRHEHILTLLEFAVVLGLFTKDEVKHHLFEVYFGKLQVDDKQFDHKDYYTRVGKPTLTNHKEVLVKEPLMRIMHKVIMGSLVHRVASRERCQKRDLWMMNALEELRGVNLAWIHSGSFVTRTHRATKK
ncbi:hypothetical protein Tco_0496450 [Tanacetum coccineum]